MPCTPIIYWPLAHTTSNYRSNGNTQRRHPALWIGFTGLFLAMLVLDLGVFHRNAHEVRFREALLWSVIWVALSLLLCASIYVQFGNERGLEFLTGYLIEKALAVDNIFVFLVIFSAFAVPAAYQHRVLFWGILGALVMRAVFIVLGAALLERFHWVMYLFGAFLVLTGPRCSFDGTPNCIPNATCSSGCFSESFRLSPSTTDLASRW